MADQIDIRADIADARGMGAIDAMAPDGASPSRATEADIPVIDTTRPQARERKPSMLAFNATGVLESLPDALDADEGCALLVISSSPLGDAARTAIESSAERLGFGADGCGWLVLDGDANAAGASDAPDAAGALDVTAETPSDPTSAKGILSPSQIWRAIEGLDPEALVIADAGACSAVSTAYDMPLKVGALNRIACRSACAFADFAGMLSDPDDKKVAWALLKRLR